MKNKDCAMYDPTIHCIGWRRDTCENCKYAKLKSEGWYFDKKTKRVERREEN